MSYTLEQFYGEAATMLDSGLDIRRVLEVSVRNSGGKLAKSLRKVQAAVASGLGIAEAFRTAGQIFADDAEFIEGGEVSGSLPEAFRALARWYGLKTSAWRSIGSGLVYPVLILHFAAFILPFPSFFNGSLSLEGYILAALSFLGVVLYGPAAVVSLLYKLSGTRGAARSVLDRVVLKVPLLGKGLRDMAIARYCGAFAALHSAGAMHEPSARIALRLCGNASVARLFEGGAASVASGNLISEGFSPRLPMDIRAFWETGERSGRLAETLGRLAESKRRDAEDSIKSFGRWLPRVVVLLMIFMLAYTILGNASVFTRLPPE